jgi:hypothetical protein
LHCFIIYYVHQIAAALPASIGGSAFAHYDQAVHGDGKFLYLLSITTKEQHGLNSPMSNTILNSLAMKVTMTPRRIPPHLFRIISLFLPPFQEATISKHCVTQ